MTATQLIESYVDDVVRRVDRKRRNDVGVELRALLGDELAGQAESAGRPADMDMAMELLRRFGRPADVAVRYRAGIPDRRAGGWSCVRPADGDRHGAGVDRG